MRKNIPTVAERESSGFFGGPAFGTKQKKHKIIITRSKEIAIFVYKFQIWRIIFYYYFISISDIRCLPVGCMWRKILPIITTRSCDYEVCYRKKERLPLWKKRVYRMTWSDVITSTASARHSSVSKHPLIELVYLAIESNFFMDRKLTKSFTTIIIICEEKDNRPPNSVFL